MKQDKWQVLGWAGVDSGSLIVTDPCYVLPREDDPDEKADITYEGLFKGFFDGDYSKRVLAKEFLASGIGGNATLFNTFDGDGNYPIVGLVDKDNRIRRVVVDLDFTFGKEVGINYDE